MRTTKRFTPDVLRRFAREGRGQGVFQDYISWHKVSRSDPASRGRSHILFREGFEHDQLSDLEHLAGLFAVMAKPDDIRFQFPLALHPAPHELTAYGHADGQAPLPGTLALSEFLGIKAPRVTGDGEVDHWVSTTDLVLTYLPPKLPPRLLAISTKYSKELSKPRTQQLLRLEREYWARRGVTWLLITENLFDPRVASTLTRTLAWGLVPNAPARDVEHAVRIARSNLGLPLTHVLKLIANAFGDMPRAQEAFWQAVWHGDFHYDLRTGWRPHLPVLTVDSTTFRSFNPILSERTAWTN